MLNVLTNMYTHENKYKTIGKAIVHGAISFYSKYGYAPKNVIVRESEISDEDIDLLYKFGIFANLVGDRESYPSKSFSFYPVILSRVPLTFSGKRTPYV